MDEKTYRDRDLLLKIITTVVVVFGAGVGLWKYLDTAERALRQPYWEQQVSLYFEATSAAAVLASSTDGDTRNRAEATFWRLYWGPLALVEDRPVEAAMKRFGDCLRQECPETRQQQLSLELADACRHSIGESWDLNLESLKGRTPM